MGPGADLPRAAWPELSKNNPGIRSLGFTPVKQHRSTHSTWQCLWVANGHRDTTPVSSQRGLEGPQGTLSSMSEDQSPAVSRTRYYASELCLST